MLFLRDHILLEGWVLLIIQPWILEDLLGREFYRKLNLAYPKPKGCYNSCTQWDLSLLFLQLVWFCKNSHPVTISNPMLCHMTHCLTHSYYQLYLICSELLLETTVPGNLGFVCLDHLYTKWYHLGPVNFTLWVVLGCNIMRYWEVGSSVDWPL